MRQRFQQEVTNLKSQLAEMATAAEEAIHKTTIALNEDNIEIAQEVVTNDLNINSMAATIEQSAYRIISLQQPVATDLRVIFAVLMASSDVERLSDHAANVCRTIIGRRGVEEKYFELFKEEINQMAELAKEMLSEAIEAFIEEDSKKARKIAAKDLEIDALSRTIYHKANTLVVQNPEEDVVEMSRDYFIFGRAFERMGDYVTNICERVVYIDSGDIVELD